MVKTHLVFETISSMLEASLLSTTNSPVSSGTFFEATTDSNFSRLRPAIAQLI